MEHISAQRRENSLDKFLKLKIPVEAAEQLEKILVELIAAMQRANEEMRRDQVDRLKAETRAILAELCS